MVARGSNSSGQGSASHKRSAMDKPELTDCPQQAGIYVADIEAAAMRRSYALRAQQNTDLFIRQHCDNTPDFMGERLADVQAMAKREALLGFAWRWALVGGGSAFVAGFLIVDIVAIFAVLILSVPVALGLSLKK